MAEQGPPPGAHVTYSREYRRCRRPGCPSCGPGGAGHGPYWYARWREEGRLRTRYLGKQAPPQDGASTPASAEADAARAGPVPAALESGTAPAVRPGPRPSPGPVPAPAVAATPTRLLPAPAAEATPILAAALRVRTLGGFALWRGETALPLAGVGRGAVRLMQCLLGSPGCRLHREQLLEALWPDLPPPAASARLRAALHALRRLLDPPPPAAGHLRWEGDMLLLDPFPGGAAPADWLDAAAFERAARRALAGQDAAACRAALALYGGPYLPDEPYADWALPVREGLARHHLALLPHLATLCRAQGELGHAERSLRETLAVDPCHEGAALALMEVLAGAGLRGEALRVYQALAGALDRELGLRPQARLEGLRARLLAETPPVAADYAPRLRLPGQPSNLPAPLSSFVGRHWELGEVRTLLGSTRLLTLVGAGGCGKSRLAQEEAGGLLEEYPDGVWLVELAPLAPAGAGGTPLVVEAVAGALGVAEQPGRPLLETLVDFLAGRALLLLLDNCEHLRAAAAALAARLLAASPRLRILATSRQALGLEGEVAWLVPALAYPAEEAAPSPVELARFEATQLFVARARAHRPAFALTEGNAGAVAQVCARLDGLPLALELAAARLGALSVAEVAARLDDRFALLTGGERGGLPRHRTLRATLDWSWELLGAGERTLLGRLSVFAGGWTLEAVEAVCARTPQPPLPKGEGERPIHAVGEEERATPRGEGERATPGGEGERVAPWDEREHLVLPSPFGRGAGGEGAVLDLLAGLVAKSLVQVSERAGESRYGLLETVRQYAREHLAAAGEEAELRMRHLRWCLALAETAAAAVNGGAERVWLARLEGEHDNLRAALRWCLDAGEQTSGPRLAGALGWFWSRHSHYSEGREWLERVLSGRLPSPSERVLSGRLPSPSGRGVGGEGGAARALALYWAGVLAFRQDDYARARPLCEESLALAGQVGDRRLQALARKELGNLADVVLDWSGAIAHYEECLLLFRALGDERGVGAALHNLGNIRRHLAEYGRAAALYEESLAIGRALGDAWGCALTGTCLGLNLLDRGEVGRAAALLEESLASYRALGDKDHEADTLSYLAWAAIAAGRYDQAVKRLVESLRLWRLVGGWRDALASIHTLAHTALARGDGERAVPLLEDTRDLARAYGDRWGEAGTLHLLAMAARQAADTRRARALCRESLRLFTHLHVPLNLIESLEEYALETLAGARWAEGARLHGVAAAWREEAGAPPWAAKRAELAAAEAAGRRPRLLGGGRWARQAGRRPGRRAGRAHRHGRQRRRWHTPRQRRWRRERRAAVSRHTPRRVPGRERGPARSASPRLPMWGPRTRGPWPSHRCSTRPRRYAWRCPVNTRNRSTPWTACASLDGR